MLRICGIYSISMVCNQQLFHLFTQEYIKEFSLFWFLIVGLYAAGDLRLVFNPQNYCSSFTSYSPHILGRGGFIYLAHLSNQVVERLGLYMDLAISNSWRTCSASGMLVEIDRIAPLDI
jgi:hypothetical protein